MFKDTAMQDLDNLVYRFDMDGVRECAEFVMSNAPLASLPDDEGKLLISRAKMVVEFCRQIEEIREAEGLEYY